MAGRHRAIEVNYGGKRMREILFRGKSLGKLHGKFIYGSLGVIDTDLCAIYHCFEFNDDEIQLVDIGTVGQFTGLTDKNGKKIFEGDIVKREYTLWHGETKKTRETQIGVVSYSNKDCGFCLDKVCNLMKPWDGDTLEVIGNIHDNPELLEAAK